MSELQECPSEGDQVVSETAPVPSPSPSPSLLDVKSTVDTEVDEQGSPSSSFAAVPSTSDTEAPSPHAALSSPLECTDFSCVSDPLDDPFLMEFTDISELLQEPRTDNCSVSPEFSVVSSPASSVNDTNVDNGHQLFDLSNCAHFIPSYTNTTPTHVDDLGIDFSSISDDALSMALSSPDECFSAMLTPTDNHPSATSGAETDPEEEQQQEEQTNDSTSSKTSRKRSSNTDNEDEPPAKRASSKTAEEKYVCRRQKNNVASQVSRAKRRSRNKTMKDRVVELETHNEELRAQEKELSAEIEKLKKMLVDRLAQ